MASASHVEDLSCSICLAIFTDPVCLPCGHSFCRDCVTNALSAKAQCPHCQVTVPTEERHLPTNYILKSLAEKAKLSTANKGMAEDLCPEHEEKLKLFCETDQQLACVICRDGKRHDGHKFKPIKEAAETLRQQLEEGITTLTDDISAIESIASKQKGEISEAEKKSCQLKNQIRAQFEEMHQFLGKREDEINAELEEKLKEAVKKMSERLKVMDEASAEIREVEVRVRSALEMSDTQGFLQRWADGDHTSTTEALFRSRAQGLQVASESFSLGPYESHLQFFVWKEMLQVVKPLPERLSLRGDNTNIRVSQDGRSLLCAPQSNLHGGNFITTSQQGFRFGKTQTVSTAAASSGLYALRNIYNSDKYATSTTSGQHYWETEVGKGDFWELGIRNYLLKYEGQKLHFIDNCRSELLPYTGRPRKIGVYLDCSSKSLSFYNADNMEHIHTIAPCPLEHTVTIAPCPLSLPQPAYFNIKYSVPPNPLTMCWYGPL